MIHTVSKPYRKKNDVNSPIFWDRFWEKVHKTTSCWIWTAARDQRGTGYGHIRLPGHGRLETAHRLAYVSRNGSIPEDALVLHSCHNKLCVNPEHLRLGNHQANAKDRFSRGADSTYRLDWSQVLEIRRLHSQDHGIREVSEQFNVTMRTTQDIVAGKTWGEGVLG